MRNSAVRFDFGIINMCINHMTMIDDFMNAVKKIGTDESSRVHAR